MMMSSGKGIQIVNDMEEEVMNRTFYVDSVRLQQYLRSRDATFFSTVDLAVAVGLFFQGCDRVISALQSFVLNRAFIPLSTLVLALAFRWIASIFLRLNGCSPLCLRVEHGKSLPRHKDEWQLGELGRNLSLVVGKAR
ncbi:hypothetical protein DITRI_Ditri20bG0000500 [Diplodiscus trichospermus]